MGLSCWAGRSERGGAFHARLMLWLVNGLGWRAGRFLLPPLVLYFLGTCGEARRASRQYLTRAVGRRATWLDLYRHFHLFSAMLLDRLFLLQEKDEGFRIDQTGVDLLDEQRKRGGVILLGAHIGSFEVLRILAHRRNLPVRPLMYRRNAGGVTRLLESLQPAWTERIIDIGLPDAMMKVAESLEHGEIVGMLADRSPAGERTVMANFFGRPAPLPAGPLLVAMVLKAPVVLCHAACVGPRHYHVSFELLPEEPVAGRADRDRALERRVARYAGWLEAICRKHPYNWFNFFDFWQKVAVGPDAADRADRASADTDRTAI